MISVAGSDVRRGALEDVFVKQADKLLELLRGAKP